MARCDSCEAAVINGVYCHEQGCPRAAQQKRAAAQAERDDENNDDEYVGDVL